MSPKESAPAPQEEAPLFDPDLLGTHLLVEPQIRLDGINGEEYRFPLGSGAPENPNSELSFYPETHLIRFTSPNLEITMRGDEVHGETSKTGVIFTAEKGGLSHMFHVMRSGEVLVISQPVNPIQEPPAEEAEVINEAPQKPHGETPTPISEGAAEPTKDNKEQQEKVTVEGNAGRDANLRETKNGKKIAKFPLAEHSVDDEGNKITTWHTIVAFNGLAEKVGEEVKKGQPYKVVGFLHEKPETKDGQETGKTIREIYAVNVKARANGNERAPEEPTGLSDPNGY